MRQRRKITLPEPAKLDKFFIELRPHLGDSENVFAGEISSFFDALARLDRKHGLHQIPRINEISLPSPRILGAFLESLSEPFQGIAISGVLSDPWAAAGLRHDEVRNASTLRWFLDPRGHPSGRTLLNEILRLVGERVTEMPAQAASTCVVAVETCPDVDRSSRVDIQIDDPSFFMIIEVKIGAGEQAEQVARYCAIASKRTAGARPFAVVFLTVDGRESTTAGDWGERVVSLSWRDVANAMRFASRHAHPIPKFLATSFANHISRF